MAEKESKKIKDLQKKNQENQRKYMEKRDKEEKKAQQMVHSLIRKIDTNPKDYRNYYDLATILVEGKNYSQAEELLMKALGIFDESSDHVKNVLNYGLGNVYYSAEEYDKAISYFQKINDKRLQAESYIMLAQSYMAKGDNKRAMVFALSAQSQRQNDPEINQMIGDNLLALGNFSEARDFYENALKVEPQNGKINFNRGLVAMVLGEDFQKYFQIAQKADPKYFENGQKRLKDIEKFIQINKKKNSKASNEKKDRKSDSGSSK